MTYYPTKRSLIFVLALVLITVACYSSDETRTIPPNATVIASDEVDDLLRPSPTPYYAINIIIAAHDIPRGTQLSVEDVAVAQWPLSAEAPPPPLGVLIIDDLLYEGVDPGIMVEERYARVDIVKGQPIQDHFLTPGDDPESVLTTTSWRSYRVHSFDNEPGRPLLDSYLLLGIFDVPFILYEYNIDTLCPSPPYDIVPWDPVNCIGWPMPHARYTSNAFNGQAAVMIFSEHNIFDAAIVVPFYTRPGISYRLTVYAQGQSSDKEGQPSLNTSSDAQAGVQISLCMGTVPDPYNPDEVVCIPERTSWDEYNQFALVARAKRPVSYAILRGRAIWPMEWNAVLFDELSIAAAMDSSSENTRPVDYKTPPEECCEGGSP